MENNTTNFTLIAITEQALSHWGIDTTIVFGLCILVIVVLSCLITYRETDIEDAEIELERQRKLREEGYRFLELKKEREGLDID